MSGINARLLCACLVAVAGLLLIERYGKNTAERPDADLMRTAAGRAAEWFELIGREKEKRGIESDAPARVRRRAVIGDEWSSITTTLGSLEAKEIAADPAFAALIVRMLHEAGIDSTDRVGVTLSGSFPSLAIATFAALRTLRVRAVVMSSLGASAYGANQLDATWIDMEGWLREGSDFAFESILVTRGAEGDAGGGLSEEGIAAMRHAVARNEIRLYVPPSLVEAIERKLDIFRENRIALLINIGGNQAALGGCPHAATIPNGYHRSLATCNHRDRGVLFRLLEDGIPCIHLLNIRDLAVRYGISPGVGGVDLYNYTSVNKLAVLFVTILIVFVCCLCYNEKNSGRA